MDDLPDTGFRLRDLAVGEERPGEWVIYYRHGGQVVNRGFKSRSEALEALHTWYDDCD